MRKQYWILVGLILIGAVFVMFSQTNPPCGDEKREVEAAYVGETLVVSIPSYYGLSESNITIVSGAVPDIDLKGAFELEENYVSNSCQHTYTYAFDMAVTDRQPYVNVYIIRENAIAKYFGMVTVGQFFADEEDL